ncbi:ATP-binding protein [Micromonospora sp. LOL_023]|uniref:ATP-binding protein n=1 Tax=Micromonospora sp. LOL_023 TaxID=3345418 RepID=UPI003A849590
MTYLSTPGQTSRIRQRERDAIVASLRAGMVPRSGQQHIQVGRAEEIAATVRDIDRIADGGAGCRFVIGEYGSGKTFFLHLVRSVALEKRLVTVHADLSPDRRLHAASGQARSLYAELMRNLATRARPEGGALASLVERFVTGALNEANATGDDPAATIKLRLAALAELTGGYDFATVIGAYWRGYDNGDERLRADAVRWLRGEFTSRVDARSALGVRTIVDDSTFYDHLKLMARFVRLAGFDGLLVCLDEMVNLYKITGSAARNANYEQVLRMVNDTTQGNAEHLGFLFGGTPEFLLDPRRGLFSYPALASRLAPNRFAGRDLVDHSGPVLRLGNLTPEDVFVLLTKLRHVYAAGDPTRYLVPDEALTAYMAHCAQRIGDAYFRTPRETIRGFLDLLALLEQHPELSWSAMLDNVDIGPAVGAGTAGTPTDPSPGAQPAPVDDDELASFRL